MNEGIDFKQVRGPGLEGRLKEEMLGVQELIEAIIKLDDKEMAISVLSQMKFMIAWSLGQKILEAALSSGKVEYKLPVLKM